MLAKLLTPISQEVFFEQYWTRQFLHVPGPSGKFADFFSWAVLNRCLGQHRFSPQATPPRLQLAKAGRKLESGDYLDGDGINATRLTKALADGATLILNVCDEVHPPLRDLCCHLEARFHVPVSTNLYAGWRTDNGFDIHWDDQDTLILQVHGRKRWKVWTPTRSHPFKRDIVDTSPKTKPEGTPVWEGILEQGGLLSIPRGWWHVAYPMDEPCLHLTVTIKNLNGIDLLTWLADQMKASDSARMELPLLATEVDKRAWLDAVRRDLAAAFTDDLLEKFLLHVDRQATPRPAMRLPSLPDQPMIVGPTTRLQLTRSRPLRFETTNGTAKFVAGDHGWQIASELVPVLMRFNDGLPHTAAEMTAEGSTPLTAMLTMLVMKGVLRPAEP